MKTRFVSIAVSLAAVLLSGCMVGPKYVKPLAPTAPVYKEQAPSSFNDGAEWKQARPGDQANRGDWWEIFRDPELNSLEDQLTSANQDLRQAEARLREARAQIQFNRAALAPTISTAPSVTNERLSANQPYFPSGLANNGTGNFSLPFDLSYEVDLWGRVRRTINVSREEAQATAADLETARLSLHAELAIDYFELRSADAQKQLLDDTVTDYTNALQLTQNRFEGGAAPMSDVAQAQTQLDAARVQDTDIAVSRAQFEHAIAVLIGQPPAKFTLAPAPSMALHLPNIPVGLPSELLERRPDIAAEERRVAEANEQIGIARAAFFPTLMIGATGGFQGTTISNWLNWPSRLWAIGPQFSQTLFDNGRRKATSAAATANYDSLVAGYRQATLNAFQEVEDNLVTLSVLEKEADQQHQATASAQQSLQLFTNRYEGGVDNYLQVITAQTVTLANERNDIDIQRRRMDASVLLVKAVGGGWSASQLPRF